MKVSSSELTALLNTSLQRLAAQSAACKLWSIVLTSLVLAMAAGRVGAEVLVWAAAPSLLFALADAAYTVQAIRLADLATKETVPAEELFGMQEGSVGFAAFIHILKGLASFTVWPFYTTLSIMVIVLGQTVLVPQNKPPINGSPFQPNTPRPAYSIQQNPSSLQPGPVVYPGNPNMPQPNNFAPPNGASQFQPPPNQITVTRPNMPPMGVPSSKPKPTGTATVPGNPPPKPASLNRPATNTFQPQQPKTQPAPNASLSKPDASQTQPPK